CDLCRGRAFPFGELHPQAGWRGGDWISLTRSGPGAGGASGFRRVSRGGAQFEGLHGPGGKAHGENGAFKPGVGDAGFVAAVASDLGEPAVDPAVEGGERTQIVANGMPGGVFITAEEHQTTGGGTVGGNGAR